MHEPFLGHSARNANIQLNYCKLLDQTLWLGLLEYNQKKAGLSFPHVRFLGKPPFITLGGSPRRWLVALLQAKRNIFEGYPLTPDVEGGCVL